MIAITKSRIPPTELQALEAFDLLSFDDKMAQLEARCRPTQSVTQPTTQPATQPEHSVKQEEEQCGMEIIAETVSSSSDTTGLLSTISHQPDTQQEEDPLQANAENTAEKPSGNKATIVKNTAHLSTIPRQIATQQAENHTKIWPAISACLGDIVLIWYIIELTIQEKDLLRRSQPSHYGPLSLRRNIGRCIFGRIETVRCLASLSFEWLHCGRRTRGIHTTD